MNLRLLVGGVVLLMALSSFSPVHAQGCSASPLEFPAWVKPGTALPGISSVGNDPLLMPWAAEMQNNTVIWSNNLKLSWVEPMAQRLSAVACENEALKARVDALESRMQALESALRALQNNPPSPSPSPAPAGSSRVQAPFVVVDAGGQEIFKVSADAVLALGAEGDTRILLAAAKANPARLVMKSGQSEVRLSADEGGSDLGLKLSRGGSTKVALGQGPGIDAPISVHADNGKPSFQVKSDGVLSLGSEATPKVLLAAKAGLPARLVLAGGQGTEVRMSADTDGSDLGMTLTRASQPVAGLGTAQGKTSIALRLFNGNGKTIAAAGENPSTPGTGLIYVGNGSQNATALATNADGSGVVHAFAADGRVGAGVNGNDRNFVAYNAAGTPITSMGKSDKSEGGNVTVYNPSGDGVASMGNRADRNNGEICVLRGKVETKLECLGQSLPGLR